jgi:hypothetical protein
VTLSILWRAGGRLHLASDSRISFGQNGSADVGVKVLRLPIRVVGTELDGDGKLKILLEQIYGFCYAGSLANAATFKLLVEDLLVGVQYVSPDVPLSFHELCGFLCHFSEKVSTEVVSRMAENGTYTFLVAGLCPDLKRLRGARFHLEQDAGRTVARFEEVAQNEGDWMAVGTGADEFESIFSGQAVTQTSVLLALNQVIDEGKVATVGGDIQYGSFHSDGDFSVDGITRISTEEADDSGAHFGPSEQRVFRYRGFELYAGWHFPGDRFWPSPPFIELNVPSNDESKLRFIELCKSEHLN